MQNFRYASATIAEDAIAAVAANPEAQVCRGRHHACRLMKLGVETPASLSTSTVCRSTGFRKRPRAACGSAPWREIAPWPGIP